MNGTGDEAADRDDGWVEVHRSRSERASRHHALVLRSRSIPFVSQRLGREVVLLVPAAAEEAARRELSDYERENRGWPPADPVPPRAPGARTGLVVYWLVLIGVWWLASSGAFGVDWWGLGRQENDAVTGGAWWRAWTSLTLHVDVVHLAGNLVFGGLFGYLVLHTFGGGLGSLALVLSGGAANVVKAWVQDGMGASVGASTCVFAAVGILAGSEWRRRYLLRHRRLRLAAPVVMGVVILAYQGMGSGEPGDRTDVLAHVLGFLAGVPTGVLLMALPERLRSARPAQVGSALATAGVMAGAWAVAVLRG